MGAAVGRPPGLETTPAPAVQDRGTQTGGGTLTFKFRHMDEFQATLRPSRATPYSHKYHIFADKAVLNGVFSSPYFCTDPEEQIWVHPASRDFLPTPNPIRGC